MEPEQAPSMGRRVIIGLAVLAACGLVGGWGVAQRGRPKPVKVEAQVPSVVGGTPGGLYVHVAGAVGAPGLYRLDGDSRVDDAVKAAGGARDDADLEGLNLASKVRDGDKILVPVKSPPGAPGPQGSASQAGGGKVNLNTATAAELETLPGVGPATAKRIIDFRTSNGGFRTPKDLQKVSGIGPKRFEALADLITV